MKKECIVAELTKAMEAVNRPMAKINLDTTLENFAVNDGTNDYAPKYFLIDDEAKKTFAETWEEAENVDEFVGMMVRKLPSYFGTWSLAKACKEPYEYYKLTKAYVRQSCSDYFQVCSVRGEMTVKSSGMDLVFEMGGEYDKATVYVLDAEDALGFSPAYGEFLCRMQGVFTLGKDKFKGEWNLWRMCEGYFALVKERRD